MGCASIIGLLSDDKINEEPQTRVAPIMCKQLIRTHYDGQSFKKKGDMLDFKANPSVHDNIRVMVVERLRISRKASVTESIKA
jgi:hypothetical protein